MTGLALASRTRRRPGPGLEVDLSAVAANTALIAGRTTGRLMAVVKADGFGHGAVDVARTALANGATSLGVTSLAEAVPLREAGIDGPMLSWLNPVDADFDQAVERRIDLAVPGREHLPAMSAVPGRARVHLHLDTGMARDGAVARRLGPVCVEPLGWPSVGAGRGGRGDGPPRVQRRPRGRLQRLGRTRFAWALETARACGLRPAQRHLAATAATLTDPRTHHTMSRVGAGLVGIDPSRTTPLRPALTLTAPLVSVRRVRAGTPVGYGHAAPRPGEPPTSGWCRWATPTDCRAPPPAAPRCCTAAGGRPVVGRISMDQAVVDLGPDGGEPGETVTVFGPGDDGEPTVGRVGGVGRHARARDRHRHRQPGRPARIAAPRLRSVG